MSEYNLADDTKQKFTSKERDNESNLDYFEARYYSSAQGRFSSVDPLTGTEAIPQSWNRYAYVGNSPLVTTDPSGENWAISFNGDSAIFRWYTESIPSDWVGHWEEYKDDWYIGANVAVHLGTGGPCGWHVLIDTPANDFGQMMSPRREVLERAIEIMQATEP